MERGFQIAGKLRDIGDDFLRLFAHRIQPPVGVGRLEAQQFDREGDMRQLAVDVVAQRGKFLVQGSDLLDAQSNGFVR